MTKELQSGVSTSHIGSFRAVFDVTNRADIERIGDVVAPAADELAEVFYQVMLADGNDAARFLDHELVHSRLGAALARWLRDLFSWREQPDEIERLVATQLHVGSVHARIDLPLHLLNHGFGVLKETIGERIAAALGADAPGLFRVLSLMHRMVDLASAAMDESYLHDLMNGARQVQVRQNQLIGQDMVVRLERLRASLFDWQRRVVTLLYRSDLPVSAQIPGAALSDFGLWITHKAGLFFAGMPEVNELERFVVQLDELPRRLCELRRQERSASALDRGVEELDALVTRMSWLLSCLIERHTEGEAARDTLTHLFNRRFLDTILQREIRYCALSQSRFAVLLVDLDHFKRINDTYGHPVGDKVLQQTAELLQSNIRAGDFLFRYGGEEFLIVMTDVTTEQATRAAASLVRSCEAKVFEIGQNETVPVTLSIGVALHDGHPDYTQLLARADCALYAAKTGGRNRCAVAGQGN